MATFHLQIVTPDRMVFDGEAQSIILRTINGDICILANHIDYAAPLGIGEAASYLLFEMSRFSVSKISLALPVSIRLSQVSTAL